MTGRERTLKALNFEPVDRTPIAGGLLQAPEYLARRAGVADFWDDPERTAFAAFRNMGCDAVLGPVMPKRPETTTTDASGRPTDFRIPQTKPELTTPEEVAAHADAAPSPEEVRAGYDLPKARDDYRDLMLRGQELAGDMLFIPHRLGYAPAFPTSDGHFSYEAFLMACALHTDRMKRLFRSWGEQSRLRLEAVAQATVEHDLLRLFWIGTDLCSADGPVLSPRLLDELYFPALEHAIEPMQAAGVRMVWHADANYRLITHRFLELGFDGFQGLYETEGGTRLADLAGMTTREGRPLIVFGSVSTWAVLPVGGPDEVRAEVRRCVEAVGERGGLLLAPSSSIGPEVPWENVDAMYNDVAARVP